MFLTKSENMEKQVNDAATLEILLISQHMAIVRLGFISVPYGRR